MAKINFINALSISKVFHKRFKPKANQFNYFVNYICFDIAKIKQLKKRFFSINKFNLFSFYFKDHGLKDGANPKIWCEKILEKEGIKSKINRIFLLTHPRILGWVFNPVNFWLCLDKNSKLIACLCQVNNTFGQTHSYLVAKDDLSEIKKGEFLKTKKDFHVSPFFPVSGRYEFAFDFREEKIAIFINYFEKEEKKLVTSLITKNIKLDNKSLIKSFFKIPFSNIKIIFLIHYQALKLLVKGAKFHKLPKQKSIKLTKTK